MDSDGFGIETELAVECVKHGVPTEVVGVSYDARPTDSQTNLHPIKDGARIYLTLFRLAKTNNPLFYFGSIGVLAAMVGLLIGAYVGYDFFINGISHEALAVVGASGIILGVQLLMFGVLSDVIVAVNREQTRRIEELAAQIGAGGVDTERYGTSQSESASNIATRDEPREAEGPVSGSQRDEEPESAAPDR
jgi:dolichol-phosphate mannosyltransferase